MIKLMIKCKSLINNNISLNWINKLTKILKKIDKLFMVKMILNKKILIIKI